MYYSDDILKNSSLLRDLNRIALSYNVVEGNLIYTHPLCTLDDKFEKSFFEKRFNLFQLAIGKQHIMEIGFNAGHSTLLMLLSNPDARYVLFDLNFHRYTDPCFQFLKSNFPQISIEYGDSRVVIPKFINSNVDIKFDLIHIDGSHEERFFSHDFENARKLSTKNTILVFDDTALGSPLDVFLKGKIKQDVVKLVDYDLLNLKNTPIQTICTFV